MEELLKELMKAVRKDKRATIKAEIKGTDAEFKIKVRGSDCKTEGEGTIAGILLALSSFTEEIKEHLERAGMDKRVVKFLLENSFYTGMEDIDE